MTEARKERTTGAAQQGGVWVVVPVKNLSHAKQRLSPVLEANERRLLCLAMLDDVLTALAGADGLTGILVVTRDAEAKATAKRFAARVVVEPKNLGQTQAVTFAARTLTLENVTSMLTVPADIPLVTPEEIGAVLCAHAPTPAVTIAPASDNRGSNAVLCSPPNVFPFAFGDNSFLPHLERARRCGIEPRVVKRPGLGLDIDVPEDLGLFALTPSDTHAYRYLKRSGIMRRLHHRSHALSESPAPDALD